MRQFEADAQWLMCVRRIPKAEVPMGRTMSEDNRGSLQFPFGIWIGPLQGLRDNKKKTISLTNLDQHGKGWYNQDKSWKRTVTGGV